MNFYQSTDLFRPYLFSGERILWSGQPKQGLALSKNDTILIPFSLMWGGFAIFWNVDVWSIPNEGADPGLFFRLWGLPFLIVGLYLIFGRFFHDAMVRKSLHYAVTNERVLILRGTRSSKLTSREIRQLPMLELTEHRDGTGTIAFDSDEGSYSIFGRNRGFTGWAPSLITNAQFFRIDNPRKVYELIRNQAHT